MAVSYMKNAVSAISPFDTIQLPGPFNCIVFNSKLNYMKKYIDYPELPRDSECYPQVSLILPFQLKMKTDAEILQLLTSEADKIEKSLQLKYSEVMLTAVMKKLRGLIATVKHQRNMSIGIFVSPLMGKIFYFNQTPQKSNYWPILDKITQN